MGAIASVLRGSGVYVCEGVLKKKAWRCWKQSKNPSLLETRKPIQGRSPVHASSGRLLASAQGLLGIVVQTAPEPEAPAHWPPTRSSRCGPDSGPAAILVEGLKSRRRPESR